MNLLTAIIIIVGSIALTYSVAKDIKKTIDENNRRESEE